MLQLRLLASALAIGLIFGELLRSWGAGRPLAFVVDDLIIGACLLVGALLAKSVSIGTYSFFVGSWALAAGMLYGSFFNKLLTPVNEQAGNWDMGWLTILVGIAFATSVIGFVCAIVIAPKTPRR